MGVNVEFHEHIKKDDILKTLENVKRAVAIFEGIAKITPTQVDDKAIDWAKKIVAAVEPFAHEEWFSEFVDWAYHLFENSQDLKSSLVAMKAMLVK